MFSAFILWISFELLSTIHGQTCSSKGWYSFFVFCGIERPNAPFYGPCDWYLKVAIAQYKKILLSLDYHYAGMS